MRRKVIAGLATVLLVLVIGMPAAGDSIILRDMDGKRVYVDSLLTRGPVVLNFWATWCKPCMIEMPHLEKLYEKLSPKGVQFAAISVDSRSRKKYVEQFIANRSMKVPVYRDPEGTIAHKFKVIGIPTTVLLDQDGEISYSTRGYRPGDEVILRKKIEGLIKDGSEKTPGHVETE